MLLNNASDAPRRALAVRKSAVVRCPCDNSNDVIHRLGDSGSRTLPLDFIHKNADKVPSSLIIEFVGNKRVAAPQKIFKIIREQRLAATHLSAQIRTSGRARVLLSLRLHGKVRITGKGDLVFGEGVTQFGKVVPIEFASHKSGRITIGDNISTNFVTHFGPRGRSLLVAAAF
jgi:hypothetical protein